MNTETNAIVQIHENKSFEDQTIYLSGHGYHNCRFFRCTFVVRESPPFMTGCHIECCIWHIDMLVHDHRHWENFIKIMAPMIHTSLPKSFMEQRKQSPRAES